MNGTTRCSGGVADAYSYRTCPLRDTCYVYKRYRDMKPEALYEIEPPFIGNQCDHYEIIRPENNR